MSEIGEALKLLDIRYEEIWTKINGIQRDIQLAYYNGLVNMLETIAGGKVVLGDNGKHSWYGRTREKEMDI